MSASSQCRTCGDDLTEHNRASSGNICKSCQSAYHKKWRSANSDILKDRGREYYLRNKEVIKARSNKFHAEHRQDGNKRRREYNYSRGALPMSENRDCPVFLGVYVTERVLANVFKNVKKMPYGNTGFDFVCGQGYKIDVKSSTISTDGGWTFHIRKNKIADYFLCLALDNRDDLNPVHIWLIPGHIVNHLTGTGVRESTINKWKDYKLDITKVISCCDTMRGATQ